MRRIAALKLRKESSEPDASEFRRLIKFTFSIKDLSVYQKPVVEKFGTFRDLTRFGFDSSTDGGSIFGISSPGCQTTWKGTTYSIGCDDGPTTS